MGIVESYSSMARRLGITRKEAIKRIRNLEKMGFLTIERRRDGPNTYYVHFFPKAS
jgi:DNA-binding MarR family transcriptional regulator